MVYHKWHCVFVPIAKNASSSIHEALRNYSDNGDSSHETFFQILSNQDPEIMESYFSFAVVRNPYDRLASVYDYSKFEGRHNFDTFDEFVDVLFKRDFYYFRDFFDLIMPQYRYITIKNIIIVDEIIKFENIDEEWKRITNIINKKHNFTPVSDKLEVLNITESKRNIPWQNYYTNTETVDKVYKKYKKDFDLFGYDKEIS